MFVDLDWPLNASSLLSASAELLVIMLTEVTSGLSICAVLLRTKKYHFFRISYACLTPKRAHIFECICRNFNRELCFLLAASSEGRISRWPAYGDLQSWLLQLFRPEGDAPSSAVSGLYRPGRERHWPVRQSHRLPGITASIRHQHLALNVVGRESKTLAVEIPKRLFHRGVQISDILRDLINWKQYVIK